MYRASGKWRNEPMNKKGLLPLWLKPWVYCRYGGSRIMRMTQTCLWMLVVCETTIRKM